MKLRKLNNDGIKRFEEYLDQLRQQPDLTPPKHILIDTLTSDAVNVAVEMEEKQFVNRFDLAQYLDSKLAAVPSIENEKGIWTWLALFYFDILCPKDKEGKYKPKETARWIPAMSDYRKYYRHLLAGPYRIYRAHRDKPERALALLSGALDKPGEIYEQLAAYQELITNKAVIETATRLYINPKTSSPRKGAAGKGAGSARRLTSILNQFDLTWDLYSMSTIDLITRLPQEFDKFKIK